jgi:hypothetical protein
MRDEIVGKLLSELRKGIGTEAQAVYLMAGIRKVLEHDGTQQAYSALYLYCNWALHTELHQGFAKEIISLLDDIYGPEQISDRPTDDSRWKRFYALTDGEALRAQLKEFFDRNDLPTYIATDDDRWRLFFSHYASAISDSPLKLKGAGRFVKQLVVKRGKAERRAGNTKNDIAPFRDAFELIWIVTTLTDEQEMVMSVSFPEDWFGPIPQYVPPEGRSAG